MSGGVHAGASTHTDERHVHMPRASASCERMRLFSSVIRTAGSGVDGAYKQMHPRVAHRAAALIGRGPPSLYVFGMYVFDAQWQTAVRRRRRD